MWRNVSVLSFQSSSSNWGRIWKKTRTAIWRGSFGFATNFGRLSMKRCHWGSCDEFLLIFLIFCFRFQVYAFEDIVDGEEIAYFGRYTNPVPIVHNRRPVYETENCVRLHHTGNFDFSLLKGRPGIALHNCVGNRFLCQGQLIKWRTGPKNYREDIRQVRKP